MRKSLLAVAAVALLVAMALPFCCIRADADDQQNEEYYIEGQVMHDDTLKASPHAISIKFYEDEGGLQKIGSYNGYLSSEGEFKFKLDNQLTAKTYYMDFEEEGYSMVSAPSCIQHNPDGGYKVIITQEMAEKTTINLTSVGNYIIMKESFGALRGVVTSSSGDHVALNGVKITLKNDLGEIYYAYSRSDGGFEFPRLSIGTYTLTADSKGFQTYKMPETIEIESSKEATIEVMITPNEGIDLSHWMTILGVATSVLLICSVAVHISKLKKRQ